MLIVIIKWCIGMRDSIVQYSNTHPQRIDSIYPSVPSCRFVGEPEIETRVIPASAEI